jgi:hypothetical protein
MTNFARTSKIIRVALALTILTPVPLFAETLTARQMLAEAQNKAVMLPSESRKPGGIELAKVEPTRTEPSRIDLAPPLLAVAAPAPVKPAPSASVGTPPLPTPAGESIPALPVPGAKPSIAAIAVPSVPAAPIAAPAPIPTPVAVAAPVATPPTAAPLPESQPRPAPIAVAAPALSPAAIATKPAHDTLTKATSKTPGEKVVARRPHGSRSETSFDARGSTINAQVISRIMQRPEVQSLIAQYGAQ